MWGAGGTLRSRIHGMARFPSLHGYSCVDAVFGELKSPAGNRTLQTPSEPRPPEPHPPEPRPPEPAGTQRLLGHWRAALQGSGGVSYPCCFSTDVSQFATRPSPPTTSGMRGAHSSEREVPGPMSQRVFRHWGINWGLEKSYATCSPCFPCFEFSESDCHIP